MAHQPESGQMRTGISPQAPAGCMMGGVPLVFRSRGARSNSPYANGDADPTWIFQATSELIAAAGAPGAPGSRVALINGATSCDVFWQVGSSATIGTYSDFVVNIMADQSIALQAYATLDRSALARIAAVTLDHNPITKDNCGGPGPSVPDTGSTLFLLSSGLATLLAFRRRFFSPA